MTLPSSLWRAFERWKFAMKSREYRERLLVALVQTAQVDGLGAFLDPAKVSDAYGLPRQAGQLRLVVNELESQGFVRPSYTLGGGEDGGLDLRITNAAIEETEDLIEENPGYVLPYAREITPASDRYVTLHDNQRAEIRDLLGTFKSHINSSNEAGKEEREIALSEIAAFEATVIQPRVSAELIERFVSKTVRWIIGVFGAAIVGSVADDLVDKLRGLLT